MKIYKLLMNRQERIKEKLSVLLPQKLVISNNSHTHQGHRGDDGSGETHYDVEIESKSLQGLKTIEQHRKINKLLQEEFDTGLHALRIKILNK